MKLQKKFGISVNDIVSWRDDKQSLYRVEDIISDGQGINYWIYCTDKARSDFFDAARFSVKRSEIFSQSDILKMKFEKELDKLLE